MKSSSFTKHSLLVIWLSHLSLFLLLLCVHASEHAESTELLCSHEDEDKDQIRVHATEHAAESIEILFPHQYEDKDQHRPTPRNLLGSIRKKWRHFWQKYVLRLPGDRAPPQMADFGAGPVRADADFTHTRRRKARSSSALAIRSESCLEAYPGDSSELVIAEEEEPHVGMVLEVYHEGAEAPQTYATYELGDPLHLELGVAAKHALDYAYTPVTTSSSKNGAPLSQDEKVIEKDSNHDWWEWWLPRGDNKQDHYSQYRMKDGAFAGGSHGEVWRGRRRCRSNNQKSEKYCNESLIFKLLRAEKGYRILEAGLREVYFGSWLAQQKESDANMYTRYVDHFFRERPGRNLELWIVLRDAGPSLRSFLYTGVSVGDYVVYQHSELWTQLRLSLSGQNATHNDKSIVPLADLADSGDSRGAGDEQARSLLGRQLMKMVLRQLVESAAFLHENGVVHRDIKPSNILCQTNIDLENLALRSGTSPVVHCVLADFSSAWNNYTDWHLYTRGPSKNEQTDEYAPPEAVWVGPLYDSPKSLAPQFDSWSIGIVALELLLGTPNVFSVDQRTRAVLSLRMQKEGASAEDIERALYLAALSQFCIYNPSSEKASHPLQKIAMVKRSCTLNDFHKALRARDPLGLGFDSSADTLLHFIWQLLTFDPEERMTATEALRHPYLRDFDSTGTGDLAPGDHNALESQMLDPRMDFNISEIHEFACPECGRTFGDWGSCQHHARARKHARFCTYDRSSLPTCLHAHSMLPAHPFSGYCDIQGRRSVIEDFHSIHLLPSWQFYGIFDGHLGNLASKYAASSLGEELANRLRDLDEQSRTNPQWKERVEKEVSDTFELIHDQFLNAVSLVPYGPTDQSGTTATALIWTPETVIITSLGDSRAVMPHWKNDRAELSAIQLTSDHVASDSKEKELIESRGGRILSVNGIDRVEGKLVVTRSIGDLNLSAISQKPDVLSLQRDEIKDMCGNPPSDSLCFVILASDGLWDVLTNMEAVDMVVEVLTHTLWRESRGLQEAAERLTLEAYVRGSTDNIGVCVVAIEQD